jgi:dihydrofolate reductase
MAGMNATGGEKVPMGNVVLVISVSVDGFVAADNVRAEAPMGDGGDRLHRWLMDAEDPRNREILTRGIGGLGAVITGRRNYEMSVPFWRANGPTGEARVPVFVLSHSAPVDSPKNGVYTFVEGIDRTLAAARAAAGEKVVSVMGGADVAQQFLRAGLIDQIQLHVVPVLLGSGLRLFEHLGRAPVALEVIEVIPTSAATHLRYRVIK